MTQHATLTNRTTGDLFEITRTTQWMRLKPDPVPNQLIREIFEAGVCAPNAGEYAVLTLRRG